MADEIPAWARDDFDPESREAIERLRAAEGRDPYEERSFEKIDYPRPAPDPYEERAPARTTPARNEVVDRALRLTSDQFQSNARPVVENGKINWGNQELGGSAADFFRADAARMAMEKEASEPQRTQLERPSGSTGTNRIAAYAPVAGMDSDTPVLRAIRGAESSNNPRAQNTRSSAGGLYQFTDGTWGNVLRRMDPQAYGGYNNQQLKSLKFNPDLQQAAAQFHLNNDIMPVLKKAGIPATPANIYLSWFQGPQGAVRAYRAPSDAKVSEVFPETVAANAGTRFRGKPYAQWTMDDLREFTATAMSRRMRADGGQVGGGSVDDQPSSDGYASENDLLQPIGKSKMVGEEKPLFDEGVYKAGLSGFSSNNKKSIRYLHHDENNNPIGVLQIMTDGPRSKKATIQNVYVAENFRRNKIASGLLKRARQDFDVRHSTDLTNSGRAFASAVKAAGGSVDDQPQRDLSPLGLYSHAAEMASQLPQERGSPQQMAGMLTNNKYQVKPVEMEGFDEAFANQPVVTRDQLVQHFKSKMPQIEEKVLGVQPQGVPYPEEYQKIEQSIIDKYSPEMAKHHAIYNDRSNDQSVRNEAFQNVEKLRDQMWSEIDRAIPNREELLEKAKPATVPTKFGQYTLPGGENYREVLLKLPEGYNAPKEALDDLAAARQRFKELEKRHNDELEAGLTGEMNMSYEDFSKLTQERDIAKARVKNFEKIVNQPAFQSSHWQEPDVLAHLRLSDRTGLNGEKILHVEEIQSDWGQKGREEGFAKKLDPKILDQLSEEQSSAMFRLEDAREAFNNAYENIFKENLKSAFKDAPTKYDLQNALKMHDEVIKSNHPQKRFDEYKSNFLRMPDSFTPEQHSLLQDAYDAHLEARDAYNAAKDKMAEYRSSSKGVPAGPYVTKTADWTDLALKRALKEAADGGYDKLIWTPGEEQAKRYSLSTKVERIAYDPEEKVFSYVPKGRHDWIDHDKTVEPKDLPGIVGKEVAEKLLATEPSKLNGIHNLEAADLEVGGHGMKGYYDKIVPTQLQKLVKKLDPEAKIGKERINGPGGPIQEILDRAGITRDEWIELGDTGRDAIRKQYGTGPEFQSLEITPKMREAVKRGLPAFASGGAVDEDEDEGITAYHGSPYDFPKFDISKIGTGEGAQAYGHGLYFAENENVAKDYRDALSQGNPEVAYKGKPLPVDTGRGFEGSGLSPEEYYASIFGSKDDPDFARKAHIEYLEGKKRTIPSRDDLPPSLKERAVKDIDRQIAEINLFDPSKIERLKKGHMYEVRIKAHPDHFLDWDKPILDQPKVYSRIVQAVNDRASGSTENKDAWIALAQEVEERGDETFGQHLHDALTRPSGVGLSAKDASNFLSNAGVSGIKYLDAGSRDKTDKRTQNYVVFNHDHVDIKRKYAQGGAIDVG